MSWDVLLIRTKTNREAMDEIKSENIILFSQAEIAREIGKIATELGAGCDCQDLSWQNLDSDSWSIEFNVGKNAETESVMLHIRGSEPKEVLTLLPVDLNARLIDCSTGEFIRPDEPTSFERWRAYRDQILGRNEM
ncbi:hypothetical protein [Enterocloster asparagiformis]|uniref:hypothetical protein n=1 Tax=Enterocloster asparagiformis TaxID=333367 RepID=UPI002A80F9BD|nr:hypothetical protein [Enterocloster asparagiformis]